MSRKAPFLSTARHPHIHGDGRGLSSFGRTLICEVAELQPTVCVRGDSVPVGCASLARRMPSTEVLGSCMRKSAESIEANLTTWRCIRTILGLGSHCLNVVWYYLVPIKHPSQFMPASSYSTSVTLLNQTFEASGCLSGSSVASTLCSTSSIFFSTFAWMSLPSNMKLSSSRVRPWVSGKRK